MTKFNISNVKRLLIATVEQREHQGNTMENSQFNTLRSTLRKMICFYPLFQSEH